MGKFIDLTGQKFGKWTVIKRNGVNSSGSVKWKCICECGNIGFVGSYALRSGESKSCGCYAKEITSKRSKIDNKIHGLTGSKIYHTWTNIKQRCSNPDCDNYSLYGGRGIKVCNEWKHDFMAFYNWSMSHGYIGNLSIDRIDVNGNYEPSNCKWSTSKEQARNRRSNHIITYNGETKTLIEWAEQYNIKFEALYGRIKNGWPIDKALTMPLGKHYRKSSNDLITFGNMTKSLKEWAEQYNISYRTFWKRIKKLNWPIEKALTTPIKK